MEFTLESFTEFTLESFTLFEDRLREGLRMTCFFTLCLLYLLQRSQLARENFRFDNIPGRVFARRLSVLL